MPKKLSSEGVVDKATDDKKPDDHEADVSTTKGKRGIEGLPGIGPKTAMRLRELGYKTLISLATARADAIAAEMGISVSYSKAVAWVKTAQNKVMTQMKLKKGSDVDEERAKKRIHFLTGSMDLNVLIGGKKTPETPHARPGFATMRTTALMGRYSSGKTQAAYDAIVHCLSLGHEAVYVETEPDTYNGDRLMQIARGRKLDINLDNLWICEASQIPTAKAQYLQYKVIHKALQESDKIKLVVVDSFTAKFRPGYSRREMLPVRTREFTEHFLLIDFLAAHYNTAWILTCQVIGGVTPGQGKLSMMKTGSAFYPVGGEYLLHSVNTWVGLQQIKTELWKATLFDSSFLPRGSCEFLLTAKGLQDGVR